jgi:hypothetical protein
MTTDLLSLDLPTSPHDDAFFAPSDLNPEHIAVAIAALSTVRKKTLQGS